MVAQKIIVGGAAGRCCWPTRILRRQSNRRTGIWSYMVTGSDISAVVNRDAVANLVCAAPVGNPVVSP